MSEFLSVRTEEDRDGFTILAAGILGLEFRLYWKQGYLGLKIRILGVI